MNPNYLDFEQPIADLEAKIEELQLVGAGDGIDIAEEINTLRTKSAKLTEKRGVSVSEGRSMRP